MRRLFAALAISPLLVVVVPASAATPKHGYYIDPTLQVYVVVNASRTSISSFQAPCQVKGSDGKLVQNGGFLLPKSKHPKLSGGAFSYSGNVTLTTDSKSVVKVKVTGKFTGGKIKGKVTLDQTKTACAPYSYSSRFYGVNPQG